VGAAGAAVRGRERALAHVAQRVALRGHLARRSQAEPPGTPSPVTRSALVRRAARQASAAGPGLQPAGLSSSRRGCGAAAGTVGAAAGLQPFLAHVCTRPRQAQRQESRLSPRGREA